MTDIGDERYISLTTYKRDGTGRATPVWITGSGGSYVFTTGDKAWKTRRLRNDPRVTVQASNMRGRVSPAATLYTGTGTVKTDSASVAAAMRAISAKYGWQFTLTRITDRIRDTIGRGPKQEVVAIELRLTASGGGGAQR